MELEKWTKNSTDPRCEFELNNGQRCCNKAVPGVTRCPLHGANMQLKAAENRSMRLYNLAKFQGKFEKFAGDNRLKTLNEEVALVKMFIQEKINRCTDETDLMIAAGPITEMVMKVQKLVESCDRLETKSGNLLSKQQIQNLATQLMQSVASKINECSKLGPEDVSGLLEAIASDFLSVLQGES